MSKVYVLLSIVLCLHSRLIWCTDLSVVYKHNVLLLKHAEATSPLPVEGLTRSPLHYPAGLAYASTRSGGEQGPLLLVTDTSNGRGNVFGVMLGTNHDPTVEPVIKSSSVNGDMIAFDSVQQSIYVSCSISSRRNAGVCVSQLPEDLSSNWAPQPSLLARARQGRVVRGLAVDSCNSLLYWSEGDNLTSSSVRRMALNGDRTVDTILHAVPGTHYQGIHYDSQSRSLLVAVTNSSSHTNSSCSFLSLTPLTHPDQTATSSSNLPLGSVAPGLRMETAATPQDTCFPHSVTADERFLYYSDLAQGGLMRLERGTAGGSATLLMDTPGLQSNIGWHAGALGVAIIPDTEEPCEATKDDPLRLEESLVHRTSTAAVTEMTTTTSTNTQNKQAMKPFKVTKGNTSNVPRTGPSPTVVSAAPPTIKHVHQQQLLEIRNSTSTSATTSTESGTDRAVNGNTTATRYTESVTGGAVNDNTATTRYTESVTSGAVNINTAATRDIESGTSSAINENLMVSVHSHPSETYDFTAFDSLSHGQLERVVVCLSAACFLFFITSLVLAMKLVVAHRRHPSCGPGSSAAASTATRPKPQCGGQDTASSYYTQHKTSTGMCSSGGSDVIIDLSSQDLKCGDTVTSSPSGEADSCSPKNRLARKPKKRFGPSKGGIKHLISKSFAGASAGGASGGHCPGLKRSDDDDGVLLNIEDCCQMTLCDTPCYSSVQKEGKSYRGGRGRDDDKRGLLDDDEDCVPNTEC